MLACALCATPAPPPFRAPPPETAPDLDGRPGEPTRSTLLRWVLRCRGCGACAPDLAQLPPAAAEIVRTDTYRALRSPFLRWAALVRDTSVECEALLQAAWHAEDQGMDGTALRRRAAEAWPGRGDPDAPPEQILRLADVLRRASLFEEASVALAPLTAMADDGVARVVAFERERIAAGDTGRHLLSSALRPPARTPHVAHGKRPAAGFWGRLFGGAA